MTIQTAKVFKSGNSQAIRLPKDFQFSDLFLFILAQECISCYTRLIEDGT